MAVFNFIKNFKPTVLLQRVIVCFCFFCFPIFIIFSGLEHSYRLNIAALRDDTVKAMQKRLDLIETYGEQKSYLHFLFKRVFELAEADPQPTERLKALIAHLKRQYPGMLKFIVWGEDGKINFELTDFKKYGLVIKKLYLALYDVSLSLIKDENAPVKNIKSLKEGAGFFKRLLGRFLISDDFRLPYLSNRIAKPFLTEYKRDYSYVWYRIGKKISFACLIGEKLINAQSGLYLTADALNEGSLKYTCGFSRAPNIETSLVKIDKGLEGALATAMARYENSGGSVFENDGCIILMGTSRGNIRVFVASKKDKKRWSRDYLVYMPLARFAALLLIFYALLWAFFYVKVDFFSIKYKLMGLFLLAGIAPLTILAFVSRDYLNNKRAVLKNETEVELSNFIRDFDRRYSSAEVLLSNSIGEMLKPITELSKKRPLLNSDFNYLINYFKQRQSADFKALKRGKTGYLDGFMPNEACVLADKSGLINLISGGSENQKDSIMVKLARYLLDYDNGRGISSSAKSFLTTQSLTEIFKLLNQNLGKISRYTVLMSTQVFYWQLFKNPTNSNYDYFLFFAWTNSQFQKQYLDMFYKDTLKNSSGIDFYAQSRSALTTWPGQERFSKELLGMFNKLTDLKQQLSGEITIDGKKQLALCSKGSKLSTMSFGALYPMRIIDKQINKIKGLLVLGAVISLVLTLIIAKELSSHFLQPINAIGNAASQIAQRNFTYRIPIYDKDEFGHLNSVFNRMAEGLADVEVARIIQENLFAANYFEADNFAIYGKSIVMTTLGGDYYDCFQINSDYWGIIIGDVAGHGIAAGLLMAMAKGGVLTASESEKLDPALLVSRLHKIFFNIKNDKLKRMMTLQYFVFNCRTGEFSFVNAGHCYPILVKPKENKAELIEHVALPLGVGRRARYTKYDFVVNPDEALFLYTDGIAEAQNKDGEEFGYKRLCEAVCACFTPDCKSYYNNIYGVYKSWIDKVTDDLTLLIVTRPKS